MQFGGVSVSAYCQSALGPVYYHCNPIKSLLTHQGCVRLGSGIMLLMFLSNQGVHRCVYVYKCVCLSERQNAWERETNGLESTCTRIGVWWSTCCDSRHHADLISVITACQPGALGTSVKLFYILLSALNVFFFCISILRQHCPGGCIHPNRLI